MHRQVLPVRGHSNDVVLEARVVVDRDVVGKNMFRIDRSRLVLAPVLCTLQMLLAAHYRPGIQLHFDTLSIVLAVTGTLTMFGKASLAQVVQSLVGPRDQCELFGVQRNHCHKMILCSTVSVACFV
jgi:hypothetical protein